MKLRGKKATEILGQTVLWVILIASLLIFSVPFFFMIMNSFRKQFDMLAQGVFH